MRLSKKTIRRTLILIVILILLLIAMTANYVTAEIQMNFKKQQIEKLEEDLGKLKAENYHLKMDKKSNHVTERK